MTATLCFKIFSFLLSQLPFSSSFVSVCVHILHLLELLLSRSFFFHAYVTIIMMMMMKTMIIIIIIIIIMIKQRKSPFASDESHYFMRQTFGILQLLESRPFQLLLFWAPFLEKGPPEIREEGPPGPHWPVSRINPGGVCLKCLF